MWVTIFRARAAYRESNPGAAAIIEPARWPLPGAQELGPVNTRILFMPKNARGRGIRLVNATAASNIEKTRVESRAVGIPFGVGIRLAGGGAGPAGARAGAGAGAGPTGAGAGAGTGVGSPGAAAGPAGAGVSSPRDEAGSSREVAGPAGAGRGRGRGQGRGLPAAKRSERAAAGPTGARAAAGPAWAEVGSPEDEEGSSREGAGRAEAEVEGKGRGQGRGWPTASRSKKFIRRRGVGPRASVPPRPLPPVRSPPLPPSPAPWYANCAC